MIQLEKLKSRVEEEIVAKLPHVILNHEKFCSSVFTDSDSDYQTLKNILARHGIKYEIESTGAQGRTVSFHLPGGNYD